MTIPIAIITLDRTAPRVSKLTGELAVAGYASTLIAAVDGRQQQPALEAPEQIDDRRALRYRQTLLTSSEIGCYLSHYRALRDARAAGHERICILEDDVTLEEDFASVFGALEQLSPAAYEFVRLMGLKRHKRKTLKSLPAGRQLTRPYKGLCGTQGYVINRAGMQKILNHGAALWRPIDKLYDHFWETDLQCFAVEPHIIRECPRDSSIDHSSTTPQHRALTPALQKQFFKLRRGWRRRRYLLQRRKDFLPATRIEGPYGNTARIH